MQLYQRVRGKYKGSYKVFDSVEECKSSEPSAIIRFRSKDFSISPGEWFVYDDGRVAQVLTVNNLMFKTVLNMVMFRHVRGNAVLLSNFWYGYSPRQHKDRPRVDLTVVDNLKMNFLSDWLLHNMPMTMAAKRNLKYYIYTGPTGKFTPYAGENKIKMFCYALISGPWFDEVLRTNRLIRDRYMSLVGSLKTAGITDVYIAQKLKEAIDGKDSRERINALNKVIDLTIAQERTHPNPKDAQKGLPAGGTNMPALPTFSEKERKELEEHKQTLILIQSRSTTSERDVASEQVHDSPGQIGGSQENHSPECSGTEQRVQDLGEVQETEYEEVKDSAFTPEELKMLQYLKEQKILKEKEHVQDNQAQAS